MKKILFIFSCFFICLSSCFSQSGTYSLNEIVVSNQSPSSTIIESDENIDSISSINQNYSKSYSINNTLNSSTSFNFNPVDLDDLKVISVSNVSPKMQDGCSYEDRLFIFDSNGICDIYDLTDKKLKLIHTSQLPSYRGLYPHSNSVSFGCHYSELDTYPLLYTNVYNNNSGDTETYGMCFVYRIVDEINYVFKLIQVINLDFVNNQEIWYNNSTNITPYSNFIVNGNDLWVYLSIFGSSITRFFKFTIPPINYTTDAVSFFYLGSEDIIETFDTFLFKYIQGCAICSNFLFSLEGYGNVQAFGYLRAVSLETGSIYSFSLTDCIGEYEPELICFWNEFILISTYQGYFFFLSF